MGSATARVLMVAVTLVVGCRSEPVVLEPVFRLTEHAVGFTASRRNPRCAVGDESRPAFGCPPLAFLTATLAPGDGHVQIRAEVPADLVGEDIVVLSTLRAGAASAPDELPAKTFRDVGREIELAFPFDTSTLKENSRAHLIAHPLGGLERRFATTRFDVPPNAMLRVGLAVSSFADATGAGATEFLLEAVGDRGRTELLRETLAPREGGRWNDRSIALGELAEQSVRFELTTTTSPSAVTPGRSTAYPLWGAPEILARRPRDRRPNFVLISLDTVRADHLGGTKDGVRLTPHFDRLASEGTRFTQTLSTYPSTSASHMSLFTGVYPAVHDVRHPLHTLSEGIRTLPQVLARGGYATAAVTENAMISGGSGFSRGFDSYRENRDSLKHTGSINRTFAEGVAWLEAHRDELFFLFLHTYEAHKPYAPTPEALAAIPEIDLAAVDPADMGWEPAKRAYAAEVHYADQALGRLVDELRRLELLEDTVLVITSDHGEEFGEHGMLGHAKSVYDEVLRVPLLFWGPGRIPRDRIVDQQTSLVDVPPTMLALADLRPPPGIPGRSLVQAMQGDPMPGHGLRFAEGSHQKKRLVTARTTRHKWIWTEGEALRVFDLEEDPGERAPLEDPELLDEGRALIEAYLAQDGTAMSGGGEAPPARKAQDRPGRVLDSETRQKLEALGYVE